MLVALLASTGRAGLTILNELMNRGHQVTAVARAPEKLPENLPETVTPVRDDLSDASRLADIIKGADAVVSAFGPASNDPRYTTDQDYTDQLVSMTDRAITAVRNAGVARLLVVGGAGSLWFSPGVSVLDSGFWPAPYVAIARSHVKAFESLKSSDINWTYFSPPMRIASGERTGRFRLGDDDIVKDAEGKNHISFEDYAIAVVDELEKPAHERARFTIGY